MRNSFVEVITDKEKDTLTVKNELWKFGVLLQSRKDKEKDQGAKSRCEGIKSGEEGQWPSRYCFRRGSLFPPCAHSIYTVGSAKSMLSIHR